MEGSYTHAPGKTLAPALGSKSERASPEFALQCQMRNFRSHMAVQSSGTVQQDIKFTSKCQDAAVRMQGASRKSLITCSLLQLWNSYSAVRGSGALQGEYCVLKL